MPINWNVSTKDALIILKIARRAATLLTGDEYTIQDASMDITATHLNGCPLRLQELLDAKDGDFGHDVLGIRRFIDRDTGKIDPGTFSPRFSEPEVES